MIVGALSVKLRVQSSENSGCEHRSSRLKRASGSGRERRDEMYGTLACRGLVQGASHQFFAASGLPAYCDRIFICSQNFFFYFFNYANGRY